MVKEEIIQEAIDIVNPANSKNLQYTDLETVEDIKTALDKADFLEKTRILLYCLDNKLATQEDVKQLMRGYASILLFIKSVDNRIGLTEETEELFNTAYLEYGA